MFVRSRNGAAGPDSPAVKIARWTRWAGALAVSAALVTAMPLATAGATVAQSARSAAAPAQTRVILGELECLETEDWTGGDEVYIKVNGETVWTAADSINTGDKMAVNRIVKVGDTVSLYDADSPDADDFLGSDIVEDDRGTLVFTNDDARYTLDYRPA
jgi:hypothetical protein